MPNSKTKNKTVLVTGATGHQGGASSRHLREKGFSIRAMTRDPEKPEARKLTGSGVEVVRGDMSDPTSLIRAMADVFGVHSVQNSHESGIDAEVRQGINVVDTARRAGVAHIVYSSVGSADQRTGIPHFDSKFKIEEHIRGTGIAHTIVRPVFFMENLLGMRQSIEEGGIRLPLRPETRLQMIAVDDIGAFVAMALERPGKWNGRAIDIAGDEMSMAELAQSLSHVEGRDVRYEQVPWDEFEQKAGKEMTTMWRWFEDTGYHVDIGGVRREYAGVTTFARWLNQHWHVATRTA